MSLPRRIVGLTIAVVLGTLYGATLGGGPGLAAFEYPNCDAVRAANAAPLHHTQPGYGPHLDRDGDGWGCDDAAHPIPSRSASASASAAPVTSTSVAPVISSSRRPSRSTSPSVSSAPPVGQLAQTGDKVTIMLLVGGALVAVGAGAIVVSRVRRHRATAFTTE